jgi:hypothetical protein
VTPQQCPPNRWRRASGPVGNPQPLIGGASSPAAGSRTDGDGGLRWSGDTLLDGGEDTISAIRDWLTVLDDDQVIVPFIAGGNNKSVVTVLERAGFAVNVERTTCPPCP